MAVMQYGQRNIEYTTIPVPGVSLQLTGIALTPVPQSLVFDLREPRDFLCFCPPL